MAANHRCAFLASCNQDGTHRFQLRHPDGRTQARNYQMSANGIKSLLPTLLIAGTVSLSCAAFAQESPASATNTAVPIAEPSANSLESAAQLQPGQEVAKTPESTKSSDPPKASDTPARSEPQKSQGGSSSAES